LPALACSSKFGENFHNFFVLKMTWMGSKPFGSFGFHLISRHSAAKPQFLKINSAKTVKKVIINIVRTV
jgi:hypothetical protein